MVFLFIFFFKQKTAYEMRISDWSSDVCSSDLYGGVGLTFPFDTWPIERIEVLRGPASVIYGDGAIGGVVNVIPKKPTRGPVENELEATLGTDRKSVV